MMKKLLLSAITSIGLMGFAPAMAGSWVINPAKCPDLREDIRDRRENIRDERYDRNRRDVREDRRDRREDRRDSRITNCPAKAWVYVADRGERRSQRPKRPSAVSIYYDRKARHYYHRRNGVKIVINL